MLIEDGAADNDETVDRYVVPTWGVESVQDVLTRAFPATEDAQGNLIALKTPEFNGTAAGLERVRPVRHRLVERLPVVQR